MRIFSNQNKLLLLAYLATSCSGFTPKNTQKIKTDQVTYHSRIKAIVDSKCVTCHNTDGIGRFDLGSFDSVVIRKESIRNSVEKKTMPPWLANEGHQDYKDNLSLTEDQRKTLLEWLDGDMLRGKPLELTSSGGQSENPTRIDDTKLTSSVMVVAKDAEFLPNQSLKDEYRCFVQPFPSKKDVFVTAFRAFPGNPKIVHHLVSYIVTEELGRKLEEASGANGRDGYTCFGGPLPSNKDEILTTDPDERRRNRGQSYWFAHWAPGMFGSQFPKDTGIVVKANSKIVTQIHYFTALNKGERDSGSLIKFNMADKVNKPAMMTLISKDLPKGEGRMVFPVGEKKTYSGTRSLKKYFDKIKKVANAGDEYKNLEIHSANLHMHAIGSEATALLEFEDGSTEILLEISNWNLHWQRDFHLKESIVFSGNNIEKTKLNLSCTFDNYRDFEVVGGLGSDDEMCLNFSYMSISKD